jgi:2-dehydro-3-deoxyphosphogluconate aldolase / (4S)-4-hydroxy-2-oxoglutarate aldolase
MKSAEILARINEIAVIPIVRTANAEAALQAVAAVGEGGIECVEITMTVKNALRALEAVADRHGDRLLLGAGTVLDPETARACMLAGAQFFVAPSLSLKTVEIARRYSKPIFPGALTPTEVLTAWEAGADGIKVFPCSAVGGAKYIKALKAPLPHIDLIPTGGVNLETIGDFLKAGSCACGVGGELVDNKSVVGGKFDVIEERARQYLAAIVKARSEMKAATA